MRKTKLIILLMTILPWFTAPFIGGKTIKRFLPGAIFMAIYVTLEGAFATKRRWWWFPTDAKPNVVGEMPLILGPFFIGSLWILKYTYKRFFLYIFVNLLVDSFFTYIMLGWLKKIGYVSLFRINKIQLSLIFMIKTLVLYGFQKFYDDYMVPDPRRGNAVKQKEVNLYSE